MTSQVSPNNLFNQICSDELLLATLGLGFKASQETHSFCSVSHTVLPSSLSWEQNPSARGGQKSLMLLPCDPALGFHCPGCTTLSTPTSIYQQVLKESWTSNLLTDLLGGLPCSWWLLQFLLRVTLLLIQIDPIVETSSVRKRLCISLVVHSGYQEVVGIYNVWDVFMSRNACFFFFLNQRQWP